LYTQLATSPFMIKNRTKFALSGVAFDELISSLIEAVKARPGTLQAIVEGQKLGTALSLSSVDNKDAEAKKLVLQNLSLWQKVTSGISLAASSEVRALGQVARGLKDINTEVNNTKTQLLQSVLSTTETYGSNSLHDRLKYLIEKHREDLKLIPDVKSTFLELTALRSLERCDLIGLSFAGLTIDNFTMMYSKVGCNFKNAVITNTSFDNSAVHSNFAGATIKKCSFEGATITAESLATLSGATIDAESFKSLIAAAKRSNIEPVIIPGVKITGNLDGADLTGVNFIKTDFQNVYSMEEADISNCVFSADCPLGTAIIMGFDKLSRSHRADGSQMKVILPHHSFAALLSADLSGLGAEQETEVRLALQSTPASAVLHPIGRGANAAQSKGLGTASSVIIGDYLNSFENGRLNVDAFVRRTQCTRLASKISDNLFGDGKGRQDEVLKLQTKLYEDFEGSNIDFKKLLDGSIESNSIIDTISEKVRLKATDLTIAGKVLFTGGIKLKIEDTQLIKDIIEHHAPKLVKMHVTPTMLERHNSESSSFADRVKAETPQKPHR